MKKKFLVVGIFLLIATLAFAAPTTAKPPKPEKPVNLHITRDIVGDVVAYGHWDGYGTLELVSESFNVEEGYDFTGEYYCHVVTDEGKGSRRSTGRQARFWVQFYKDADGDGIEDEIRFYSVGYPGEVIKDKKQYKLVFDNDEFFFLLKYLDDDGCVRDFENWYIYLTFTVDIT